MAVISKQLDGLRWTPRWVSHLGCVHGCLAYLGADISIPWLYGGTGHAFIINVHEVVCPSGPTAWNYVKLLFDLPLNLGFRVSGVYARNDNPAAFAAKQKEAWEHIRASLDKGIPCYGWELHAPEFYTIHGYDDVGYYFSGPGCDNGRGPKPWHEVGMSPIGVLEMYSIESCAPEPDERVVKDAFSFALEHAENLEDWIFPGYRAGPPAYDLWAQALEDGTANRFGQGYNAAVWAECRENAVVFLKEARARLSGKADALFDEAIGHYTVVNTKLQALAKLHPFQPPSGNEAERVASPEGAVLVREAGAAEEHGLALLAQLRDTL